MMEIDGAARTHRDRSIRPESHSSRGRHVRFPESTDGPDRRPPLTEKRSKQCTAIDHDPRPASITTDGESSRAVGRPLVIYCPLRTVPIPFERITRVRTAARSGGRSARLHSRPDITL
ncbi:hypothetical protein D8S78_03625 [Natrialba swarupiae]|nr:hypothetical protein [Natrialba swarupiae]